MFRQEKSDEINDRMAIIVAVNLRYEDYSQKVDQVRKEWVKSSVENSIHHLLNPESSIFKTKDGPTNFVKIAIDAANQTLAKQTNDKDSFTRALGNVETTSPIIENAISAVAPVVNIVSSIFGVFNALFKGDGDQEKSKKAAKAAMDSFMVKIKPFMEFYDKMGEQDSALGIKLSDIKKDIDATAAAFNALDAQYGDVLTHVGLKRGEQHIDIIQKKFNMPASITPDTLTPDNMKTFFGEGDAKTAYEMLSTAQDINEKANDLLYELDILIYNYLVQLTTILEDFNKTNSDDVGKDYSTDLGNIRNARDELKVLLQPTKSTTTLMMAGFPAALLSTNTLKEKMVHGIYLYFNDRVLKNNKLKAFQPARQ